MSAVLNMASAGRFFNPFKYPQTVSLNGSELVIKYTRRARQALEKRSSPLVAEMQIYFSCVVQKRVLFHDGSKGDSYRGDRVVVNDKLSVAIRSVESQSCDPEYFASNHPEKKTLDSSAARKMTARELIIDYKNNQWQGSFSIV